MSIPNSPELFPDEVVTKAYVRDVDTGAGTMALITLDNGFDHNKPNTFGPGGLLALNHAIDEVAGREDIVAVGVTGKPFIFAVGADLTGVPLVDSPDKALAIGQLGHAVFRRLGELTVPSFAFVNGAALGGGLEVALHCTYRTISSGVAAVALPECFLGMVPAWGGCYLLPRLIGPAKALKIIIDNALSQNKMMRGPEAFEMGIADAMFEPADFLEESVRWAARVLRGELTVERHGMDGPSDDRWDWDQAVSMARFTVEGKLHGAAPAPPRAVDLVAAARTSTRDQGFAAEDEAQVDLLLGDELRAGLYAFDLVQKRARHPAGAPDKALARPVTKVGIVGAGLMAAQIAPLFARRLQVPVLLTDLDQQRVDSGVGHVHAEIAKLALRGRISADQAARLTGLVSGSVTKGGFADADLVIEAVFEDLDVKRRVFAEVEAVVRADCVLATNTSSLSVSGMARDLDHPERVVGFHFFNPVAVLPLVEVVRAEKTDDATLATAFTVGKSLKKSCVLVKDSPAFVVNRLLTRFLGEILRSVTEGTPAEVAEHAADPLGLPMPPLMLLQLVGPAVALHVAETLEAAFGERFAVSPKLREFVASGKTAIYGPDFSIDPEVKALFAGGDSPSQGDQILARALEALAEEIGLMLAEGVVAAPQDIDLCMIGGAGWPFHLGGITPYLDRTGISAKVTGSRFAG